MIKTRSHIHEEHFSVEPQSMFDALITPSSVRSWWGASSAIIQPNVGGVWVASWGDEDEPDYTTAATLTTFDRPKKLVLSDYRYYAKAGPLPFKAHFETEFTIVQREGGSTLRVEQKGFPAGVEANEFFEGCVLGWTQTFKGIRTFLLNRTE